MYHFILSLYYFQLFKSLKVVVNAVVIVTFLFLSSCNSSSQADEGSNEGGSDDSEAPVILSIKAKETGTFKENQVIEFDVIFDEVVVLENESPIPLITFEADGNSKSLSYSEGTETDTMTFVYTVQSGDLDENGVLFSEGTITIEDNKITDLNGNELKNFFTPFSVESVKIDAVRPTLQSVSIESDYLVNSSKAAIGSTITLSFTASEALEILPSVTIMGDTISPSAVENSDNKTFTASYQFQSDDPNGDAYFTIDFNDVHGNQGSTVLGTTDSSSIEFNTANIQVDTSSPQILSFTNKVESEFKIGDTIEFELVFNEEVFVSSSSNPRIQLDIGGVSNNASYFVGSASDTLTFTYTVQDGDNDQDGLSLFNNDLIVNADQMEDSSGNDVLVAINSADVSSVFIDGIRPSFDSITISSTATGDAGFDDQVTLNFALSEELQTTPSVTFYGQAVSVFVNNTTDNSYYALYTIQNTDASGDVPFTISNVIDAIGNTGDSSSDTTDGSSVTYTGEAALGDTTAPFMTTFVVPAAGSNGGFYQVNEEVQIQIVFSENVNVKDPAVIADHYIPLNVGSNTREAFYSSGTGSNTLTYIYTVQTGDVDNDGISIATSLLNVPVADKIEDASGNDANYTFPVGDFSSVFVDNEAPSLSLVSLSTTNPDDSKAFVNDVVTLTVQSDEALSSIPTISIYGSSVIPTSLGGNIYSATRNMLSSDASGDISFTISFTDLAGNDGVDVTAITEGNNINFDASQEAEDTSSPIILTVVPPSSGTYNSGDTLDFTVIFDDQMVVSGGEPSINLVLDTGTVAAVFNDSESSGANLVFSYTIKEGDNENSSISYSGGFSIDTNGASIEDDSGNAAVLTFAAADPSGVAIDAIAPTLGSVSISSTGDSSSLAVDGDTVMVSFSSSETITGVSATIAGNPANVSGSGTAWTASYQMDGTNDAEGAISFTIDFEDTVGNEGQQVVSTTDSSSVTYDTTQPTISSITRASSSPTNSTNISFTVLFNESVQDLPSSAIQVITTNTAEAAKDAVSGSGNSYTVNLSNVKGNGTVTISVNSSLGEILDLAGNSLDDSLEVNAEEYTIDNQGPEISISSPSVSITNGGIDVSYSITYESDDTSVIMTPANFNTYISSNFSGTSASMNLTGSGLDYTLTFSSISGAGTIGFSLANNSAVDGLGNFSDGTSDVEAFSVDDVSPSMSSISRVGDEYTNAEQVQFTITFDEEVSLVVTSDFNLALTGVTANLSAISGSGTSWTATISDVSGDGDLELSLNDGDNSILDLAGNSLSSVTSAGTAFVIDNTPPTITIGSPSPSTITDEANSGADYQITYNDENGTGATNLTVFLNRFDVTLANSGDASANVSVGDTASNNQKIISLNNVAGTNGELAISIAADTAQDQAGNFAAAVTDSEAVSVDIDTDKPFIISIERPSTHDEYVNAVNEDSVIFEVLFSETVNNLVAGDFEVNTDGDANGVAASISGSGPTYYVTVNTLSGTGFIKLFLDDDNQTVTDGSGNFLLQTQFQTNSRFYLIDDSSPDSATSLTYSEWTNSAQLPIISWTNPDDAGAFTGADFDHAEIKLTSSGDDEHETFVSSNSSDQHIFTLASPEECTEYFPAVEIVDQVGLRSTELSNATGITFDSTIPSAPLITTSAPIENGSPSAAPSISWTQTDESCGFDSYEIAIRTDGFSTNDILDWVAIPNSQAQTSYEAQDGVDGISITMSSSTDYLFLIRAKDKAGNISTEATSDPWTVSTTGPDEINESALYIWLDSNDKSTLFTNTTCTTQVDEVSVADQNVACWLDKASSAAFTNTDTNDRPDFNNNDQGVFFNGVNAGDVLSSSSVSLAEGDTIDFFVVFEPEQQSNKNGSCCRPIFSWVSGTSNLYPWLALTNDDVDGNSDIFTGHQGSPQGTQSTTFGQTYLLSATQTPVDGTNDEWHAYFYDVSNYQNTFSDYSETSEISVGGDASNNDRRFHGRVLEVIVYKDNLLSSTERERVEGYLACKWDFRDQLSTGHPYYNSSASSNSGCP